MATPLELIKAIFTVVDTIQKVVQEVQCNKARCRRLRERICGILPIVRKLETHMKTNQKDQPESYTDTLQEMLRCLGEAQEYMETFTSHKGFKASIIKVAGRDEIKRRFEGFNEKLTDLVPVLTMGLQVEAQSQLAILRDKVKLKQEDDEDEKKDWEEIMKIIKDLKGLPDQVDKVSTDIAQLTKEVRKGFDQQKRKYEDMQSTADMKLEPIEEDDLIDLTEIGKGRFGKVYKGKWIQTHIPVAVKMMDKSKSFDHEEVAGNLRDEATQMKKVETENVVRVWGIGTRSQRILLVLEFMEKGPLRDVLRNKAIELPWERRVRMALEAARGLHAIHNARPKAMLHRNISSKKFLVDEDLHVKVYFLQEFCYLAMLMEVFKIE
uniref:Protein kinase domain-containing protein n=1 Tax=Branchiostoma floridae TaxID=7739 RepID=C3XTV6_BRAFL|eukprot:XP_002612321.1 hypothetical protein BRAFLDRAFT_80063 [Branchiostoma floridae]